MADFQSVATTAGEALRAQNEANGVATNITSVELGQANRTPTAADTGVQTQFSPRRIITNPAGVVSGNEVNWQFQDTGADAYVVRELAFFSGTTCVFVASAATGAILSKPADTAALFPILITFSGATLTTYSFTESATPAASETVAGIVELASQTEAQADAAADQSTSKVLSVRRGFQQIARWWDTLVLPAKGIRYGTADPVDSVGVDGDIYIKLE